MSMTAILQFLDHQSGDRLVGYGILLIIVTYYATDMIVNIFRSFRKHKK